MAALDPQLAEYREQQRQRFQMAQASAPAAVQQDTPGSSSSPPAPSSSGPVSRPAASAEALRRQLAAALSGGSKAEVLAVLDIPEVQLGLLQWVLLSRLGDDFGNEETAGGFWAPIMQGMMCMGVRERSASDSARLDPLLRSRPALEGLLLSGGCSDWPRAVQFFCLLLDSNPSCAQVDLHLRLAAASALCYAEGQTDTNMHEQPIDPMQRYRHFCRWADEGKLFTGFQSLTVWHLRYVFGSWHGDDCLLWARQNVERDLCCPSRIGRAAQMVRYREFNDAGVSVQEGLRFYDGLKSTMPVMHSYGGVCGAVSKFGASACQAFGVPAMPVGQPGHCALLWRGAEGDWQLENDNSGLSLSRMHDGIQRTWRELGEHGEAAGVIAVMEQAQAALPQYVRSELLRLSARLPAYPRAVLEMLTESVKLCRYNLLAWKALLEEIVGGSHPAGELLGVLRECVVEAEATQGSAPYDLSLLRPVRASSDLERGANVVDGTSSEWFPSSPAPQWLEVDLQRPCSVALVRVQWWGDYGSKTGLQVSSRAGGGGGGDDAAGLVRRCRREAAAEFNGWTELRGWGGPGEATRVVRFDLDGPSPDCFGLGKQYGIRQIQILGRRSADIEQEEAEGVGALLNRWIEVAFATARSADTQAQRFLKAMVDNEAASLASLPASSGECIVS